MQILILIENGTLSEVRRVKTYTPITELIEFATEHFGDLNHYDNARAEAEIRSLLESADELSTAYLVDVE
jgi:hypothetical protein